MESQSLICQQQAPHLQQQRQICTFVWLWNVESYKCHLKQIANLYQPMSALHPKHPLVRQSQQSRSLATRKTRPNPATDRKKKMEMDWPLTQKTTRQHHTSCSWVESTRKEMCGTSKDDLAKIVWRGNEGMQCDLGRAETNCAESSPMENCCWGPMFH